MASVLGLNAALIRFSPSPDEQAEASTFSDGPKGTSALYALLEQSGLKVSRKKTSMRIRPQPGAVLVSLSPNGRFDAEETLEIKEWLGAGGTAILGVKSSAAASGFGVSVGSAAVVNEKQAGVRIMNGDEDAEKKSELKPFASSLSPLSRGVKKLDPAPDTVIYESGAYTVYHIEAGPGAIVAERRVGKGRLLVFTCPDNLENKNLGKADNLTLFLNMLNSAGMGREVVFDEYHHGYLTAEWTGRMAFFMLLFTTPYGLCASLIALGLVFWLLNRDTVGVRRPQPFVDKASSLEHIKAVARLHARLNSHDYAARRLLQTLRREMTEHLALDGNADFERALSSLADGRPGLSREAVAHVISTRRKLVAGEKPDARETLMLARCVESIRREFRK